MKVQWQVTAGTGNLGFPPFRDIPGLGTTGWISTTGENGKRAQSTVTPHGSDASLQTLMASVSRHHIEYSRNRCSASPTVLGFAR